MAEDNKNNLSTPHQDNGPGWGHRLNVVGEYLNRGLINTLSAPGYLVDAINHAPRLLNVLPGVENVGPISERPFLGSAMIHDSLTGTHEAYKDTFNIATPELVDATDRILAGTAEFVGGMAVPMVGAASSASRAATLGTRLTPLADDAARVTPLDTLVDVLSGANRQAAKGFAATSRTAPHGSLAAAEAAGLSSSAAFSGAAKTTASVTNNMGTLLANTALTGGRLATVGAYEVTKRTAGFSLRHPFLATSAAAGADMAWNEGRLTAAATDSAVNFAVNKLPGLATTAFDYAATAAPKMIPTLDFTNMLRDAEGRSRTPTRALEESLGIDIPDTWERKGNQLLRDFSKSSFGQWLAGGSWGAKLLSGLLAFVLMRNVTNMFGLQSEKGGLLSLDSAANVVSIGVAAMVAQNLPALVEAIAGSPVAENDNRPAPALDFAPSNAGAMSGGMSFAPAGP